MPRTYDQGSDRAVLEHRKPEGVEKVRKLALHASSSALVAVKHS